MNTRIGNLFLLFLLVLGTLALPPQKNTEAKEINASPEDLLKADGTLHLDGTFSGALDLEGWDVQMDPERGPLFSHQTGGNNKPAALVPFGTWEAIGDGSGVVQSRVRAIFIDGSNVYIGGEFVNFANIPEADYLVKWDGANWSAVGTNGSGNGALSSVVYGIVKIGSNLYAGGGFSVTQSNASVPTANYIAKWDGASWSGLGSNGSGGSSLGSPVTALAVIGTTLYVGGYFQNVNNNGTSLTAADYVAQWDGTNWSALGSNGASDGSLTGAFIGDLEVIGTDLFVGGSFSNVNNNGVSLTAADNIVKWDGTNWSALSSNGSSNGSIGNTVNALAVIGSDLYAGGQFTNVNNGGSVLGAADYIAKWDGTDWSALGSNGAGNGSLSSSVTALSTDGVSLFVGGDFQNVNDNGTPMPTVDVIAKWDGANWSGFGNNGSGNGVFSLTNTNILAIAVDGSNIWMGGVFFDPNNSGTVLDEADHLARWDGSNWNAATVDSNGSLANTFGGGSARVNAILVDGTDIYVGGNFTNISNHGLNMPAADYIVKWDGANWSALGSNGAGGGALSSQVNALAMDGNGNLYVGGEFFNVNNNGVSLPTADYVAKWDGTNWSALGSNGASDGSLNSNVNALAVSGTDVYVGGNFQNVNNGGATVTSADYVAKWDGTNWSALGSNGASDGSLSALVLSLAVSGSDVYVGGSFQNVNNSGSSLPEADYIARWDGANWSALGSNGASDGSLSALVDVITVSGTDVYVGGAFQNVKNGLTTLTAADNIARWDGANWSALGSNGVPNDGALNSRVFAIVVDGTNVYAGGMFQNVNNGGTTLTAADYAAKWNGTNWSALGVSGQTSGSLDGLVYDFAILNGDLLVGGQFANVRNQGTTIIKEADYLAAYGITPDVTAPTVASITRTNPDPTAAASVNFTVTFSETVTGVAADDFNLFTTGSIAGASITGVSGSGTTYTVTVNTGSGSGMLRLDLPNSASIVDNGANNLTGLPYTSGESYTVNKNNAPTDVALSASSLTENLPAGTTVGTLSTTDPNAGDTFTYSLVSGTGSDDNAAFSITGNTLKSAQPFNFLNKNSYSIRVRSTDSGSLSIEKAFTISITNASPIFVDVPDSYWAVSFIERLFNAGITGGCSTSPLNYCPENTVTRAQMAVFLLKGIHGSSYMPPVVGASTGFNDVAIDYWAAAWIKQLAAESITGGCGGGNYCPDNPVTRAQMAVFLLKAKYGSSYAPPAIGSDSGFTDVAVDHWAAAWIKQLAAEGITSGCAAGLYCPETAVNRAQMAVFLVKTFNLP